MAERFLSARPRPEAVQGAKRTLDGEDRSDTMKREGGEGDCTKERFCNTLDPDGLSRG